jgi:twitching motility protein PilI
MAQREALRELQSRLAERLQQARTQARSASWLALECAGQGLLVALPSAGEIFVPTVVMPVPHTRAWFLGVANLRGQLHGVVDLAAFLGLREPLSPAAVGAREGARASTRLVALNPALGSHCAVLVDRLAGLRSAGQLSAAAADGAGPADPASPASGPSPRPRFAGPLWHDAQGRAWQEIDLGALARHEQFLGIAA